MLTSVEQRRATPLPLPSARLASVHLSPLQCRAKRMPETIVYTLPSHWACALINDDESGMEIDDMLQLNQFMRGEGLGAPLDVSEDGHFCPFHDARGYGVLACDCLDYTFVAPV